MEQETKYHKDDLRADLIEKGLKLLNEEGYESFSLRKVAKACGVSHAAPYRHFSGKDELIAEIARGALGKFTDALQSAVDRYPDEPEKQLREMGCAYVRFFYENPEYLRLLFFSDLNQAPEVKKKLGMDSCENSPEHSDSFAVLYRTIERLLDAPPESSAPRPGREEMLLYSWGLVHGISVLLARGEFPCQGDPMELTRKILWNKDFL